MTTAVGMDSIFCIWQSADSSLFRICAIEVRSSVCLRITSRYFTLPGLPRC